MGRGLNVEGLVSHAKALGGGGQKDFRGRIPVGEADHLKFTHLPESVGWI